MISALVLAAGSATRFGRTKQLEVVRGKPLPQHAIDAALEAGLGEIVVVLGHDADAVEEALRLPSIARVVRNPGYASGLASSLAVGLRALVGAADAAIVLLGDQPGITATHLRALVDAFRERSSPIVRLRFDSGPGPALLARETWEEAAALAGDAGARVLIERHPGWVRDVDVDGDPPVDVDTPEDLERA